MMTGASHVTGNAACSCITNCGDHLKGAQQGPAAYVQSASRSTARHSTARQFLLVCVGRETRWGSCGCQGFVPALHGGLEAA